MRYAVPAGQLIVFFRASPAGRSLPLSMFREILLFVVCRIVSLGRLWKGGLPLGFSMTQLIDILREVCLLGAVDCVFRPSETCGLCAQAGGDRSPRTSSRDRHGLRLRHAMEFGQGFKKVHIELH